MKHQTTLEFDTIVNQLSGYALSEKVKTKCQNLQPLQNIQEVLQRLEETTQAKKLMEQMGTPPLPMMAELEKIIVLLKADGVLLPEQVANVAHFLSSCRRMKGYLKRAESTGIEMAFYGGAILELTDVSDELDRCVINGQVDEKASPELYRIRQSIYTKEGQIRNKLEEILRKHRAVFSESFISMRNGHYTLPVKREHKSKIDGLVVEVSNTGNTCFIEPNAIAKIRGDWNQLLMEEDNEVRRILYELTALIYDYLPSIEKNVDVIEVLDFLFAKAKLSMDMGGNPVGFTEGRQMQLVSAKHPLLPADAVPLDFALGEHRAGVIITGPNTGGKTVALKTIGLLSLMAQSGLHIPAHPDSALCMFHRVLCDIGDGQSITENLSTFSAHMTNMIDVLEKTDENTLVLLDELGSGTDPAEGMGIAIAIIEALLQKGCLFTVTTHYPEIKTFASQTKGIVNARMAFDRESLKPLYRLEIGEAGESCALFIAERLGMPSAILKRAAEITYGNGAKTEPILTVNVPLSPLPPVVKAQKTTPQPEKAPRFVIGDSVLIYPEKKIGIVFAPDNEKGEVGVQIKKEKLFVNHKRLKLKVASKELYPDDYDFSIVFDPVAHRKARKLMSRKHVEGNWIEEEGANDVT